MSKLPKKIPVITAAPWQRPHQQRINGVPVFREPYAMETVEATIRMALVERGHDGVHPATIDQVCRDETDTDTLALLRAFRGLRGEPSVESVKRDLMFLLKPYGDRFDFANEESLSERLQEERGAVDSECKAATTMNENDYLSKVSLLLEALHAVVDAENL